MDENLNKALPSLKDKYYWKVSVFEGEAHLELRRKVLTFSTLVDFAPLGSLNNETLPHEDNQTIKTSASWILGRNSKACK